MTATMRIVVGLLGLCGLFAASASGDHSSLASRGGTACCAHADIQQRCPPIWGLACTTTVQRCGHVGNDVYLCREVLNGPCDSATGVCDILKEEACHTDEDCQFPSGG